MSEAPAELWLRPWAGGWYETQHREDPAAVRYVRADLYEALMARLTVVRSWNEAPCLEPLPPDAGSHEQQPNEVVLDALRALRDDNAAAAKLILRSALHGEGR